MLMVKAQWAEGHAKEIAALRKALDKAEAFIRDPANFGATLEVLKATFGIQMPKSDEIAEVVLRGSIGTFGARGNTAAMQAVADNMTATKLLPVAVDMSSAVLP